MKAILTLLSSTARGIIWNSTGPTTPGAKENSGLPPPEPLPEIPPAIWEEVINFIVLYGSHPNDPAHEDWLRTVHTCTGVCKAWRASVHRFTVPDNGTLLLDSTCVGVIVRALDHSPVLSASVRVINLLCTTENVGGAFGYELHNAATHFFPALAPHTRFPLLRELRFLGVRRASGGTLAVGNDVELLPYLPLPLDLPAVYARWAGQVRVLWILGMTFAQFSDLMQLVACFPRVQELQLATVRWSDMGDDLEYSKRLGGDGEFLGSLKKLLVNNLLSDGVERILRALKPQAPQELTSCLFYDGIYSDDGTCPKFFPLDLTRMTCLTHLILVGVSRLHNPASVQAMLSALRATLRSWRPSGAAGPLCLELDVSAVPVLDYEQWVGNEPLSESPPNVTEFKAFLRELGEVIMEECARLHLETLLVTTTNIPGQVEGSGYWHTFFKNHVFPTGMPALICKMAFEFRPDLRWRQEDSDLDVDTQRYGKQRTPCS